MTPIVFGTDGWRAGIAEDYTFENVRYCAQGTADYLRASGQTEHGVVVGYDLRFRSEDFARAVAEVLAAHPQQTAALKAGQTNLRGFLVGQVLKAGQGRLSPAAVNEALDALLAEGRDG